MYLINGKVWRTWVLKSEKRRSSVSGQRVIVNWITNIHSKVKVKFLFSVEFFLKLLFDGVTSAMHNNSVDYLCNIPLEELQNLSLRRGFSLQLSKVELLPSLLIFCYYLISSESHLQQELLECSWCLPCSFNCFCTSITNICITMGSQHT